jgi:ribulose bisphosphate carboxylase small subunit
MLLIFVLLSSRYFVSLEYREVSNMRTLFHHNVGHLDDKTDGDKSSDLSHNRSGNLLFVEPYNRICL